jgi:hypothetical protein
MPFRRSIVFVCLILAGCQSAPVAEKPATQADQQWQASTLSPETIAKAEAAVRDYQQCLNQGVIARNADRGDPRDITNQILKACEDKLPAIKTAFDTEHVPSIISERKIQQTRSHGVQSVLKVISMVQAQKAGEEAEARDLAQQNKKKHH